MKNYYKILGVHRNDDTTEIKKKTKIKLQNVEFNSQQFNEIKEAYEILTSYFKRQDYEKQLIVYEKKKQSNNSIIDYDFNNNFNDNFNDNFNNSLFNFNSNFNSNFNNSFLDMNKTMNNFKIPNISNNNKSYFHSSSYSSSTTNNNGEKEVYSKWTTNNNGVKKNGKKHFIFDKNGKIKLENK